MRIELSHQQSFGLAEEFAKTIHGQIVEMHLRVSDELFSGGELQIRERRNAAFREVQQAIASLPSDGVFGERRNFLDSLKWHLDEIFKEKGTDRKWQTYIARVAEARRQDRRAA